jgi:tricarballylate dehydrogenase
MTDAPDYDVVVLGGGNAALCAALTARQSGRSVVVIECAPRAFRGGNSRHTRNLRSAHDRPTAVLPDSYTDDEFFADLLRVNKNDTDQALARLVVQRSFECAPWMAQFGVRFQSSLRGTLHLARTNAFFLGGGKAVMNSYYAAAARMGIDVLYDAEVVGLDVADGIFSSAQLRISGDPSVRLQPDHSDLITVRGAAVVLATGGFEANIEWLKEAWGDAANNFIVRGTPYNTGKPLKLMLDAGAQSIGDPRGCHAIAVDARAPRFDGGIVTRLDCIPLGIVVNRQGLRFADEGEDVWPKRYASWGSLVAQQPEQTAFCLVDAKTSGLFMPSVFPPIVAESIRELAVRLGVSPDGLEATVAAFNRAVRPGAFDHTALDDCRTAGLSPEKTHWAQRLDTPPFWGYPLRPGITFTYLGLKVDDTARVVMSSGVPARNIYAAGEIMAGNVLRQGYIAGIGMTIGTVFGRIAGKGAAQHAAR